MLKQLLENKLPIKIILWDTEKLYRKSVAECEIGNYEPLINYIKSLDDFVLEYKKFWEV